MNTIEFLSSIQVKTCIEEIDLFLASKPDHVTIYPEKHLRYQALTLTPIENVKVVILGQDPYHQPNQAHGLAFSTLSQHIPKSLQNIFKAISMYEDHVDHHNGNLERWAKQGVLLWNVYLTVEQSKPLSHAIKAYETLTRLLIETISTQQSHVVFLLWGSFAQSFKSSIGPNHFIIEAPHPSPLSVYRGFYTLDMFRKTNDYLIEHHRKPIDWR